MATNGLGSFISDTFLPMLSFPFIKMPILIIKAPDDILIYFLLRENKIRHFMKCQALFSHKNANRKKECHILQFLISAL